LTTVGTRLVLWFSSVVITLMRSLVIILLCLSVPVSAQELTFVVYDVDQGSANLIVSPSGRTMIYDGGYTGYGDAVIVPDLSARGITYLDVITASHYHADHIGGLDEVVDAVTLDSVGIVYDHGGSYGTQAYSEYAAAVGPLRTTAVLGDTVDLGGGAVLEVVSVNGNGVPGADNENDLCVGYRLSFGEFDLFAAGDLSGANAGGYVDVESVVAPLVGEVEVYVVDHHGSAYNSNQTLVDSLRPEAAVYSVGDNTYGHPTQVVIDRLAAAGAYQYQTNQGNGGTLPGGGGRVVNGHVVIITDGASTYTVDGDIYPLGSSAPSVVELPRTPLLLRAYPNPANPRVTLFFSLDAPTANASLILYDVLGRRVRVLHEGCLPAGEHRIVWDGTDRTGTPVASGVYFAVVQTESSAASERIAIVR
jgi:beta-lactamase superfamily II metal-dependent hydrolase